MNIPNFLTIFRIALIPLFVILFYIPTVWGKTLAAFFFALAAFTDWLDGYLARLWQQVSPFGEFLDPVADKLMVSTALVLIAADSDLLYVAIPIAIIIGREIVISALREWMAELGKRASIAVSFVGKTKTVLQFGAIICLVLASSMSDLWLLWLGYIALYVAAALTIWSMVMYLQAAWPSFNLTVSVDRTNNDYQKKNDDER